MTSSICIGRVERMKEAKSEAEQVIAAYRAEMEAEYQKEVSKVSRLLRAVGVLV